MQKLLLATLWFGSASALVLLPACDSADAGTNGTTTGGDVPEVFQQFASTVDISRDGDFIVLLRQENSG